MDSENTIENEQHTQQSKTLKILAIIFFVIGALIFIVGVLVDRGAYSKTTSLSYQTGYIIGKFLVVAFLVYIVQRIFKKNKRLALMVFSIIFLIVSCVTTVSAVNKRSHEIKLNKVAMTKLISISRDYADGKDLNPAKFDESTYGNMSPFLDLCNHYFISFQKLSTDMKKDVADTHLETAIGADAFTSPAKIKDAQKRVELLITQLDKFQVDANNITKNMKTDIVNSDIPEIYKKDVASGFEEGQVKSSAVLEEYILFEKNVMKKIDESIIFMSTQQGNYEVKNNMVYFNSNDALTKFNKNMSDIQAFSIKETSIENNMKKMVNDQLNTMESLNK